MNEILHYLKFKNLSKTWAKYVFNWEELDFEHIGNSAHTAEFVASGKVLNIYINMLNESTTSIPVYI